MMGVSVYFVTFTNDGYLLKSYAVRSRAPAGAIEVTPEQLGQLMGRELRLVDGVLVAV